MNCATQTFVFFSVPALLLIKGLCQIHLYGIFLCAAATFKIAVGLS